MDKSDDLLSAEEPSDEFYHDNTIEDQINLDKSELLNSFLNNWKGNCR
jgi:hypothetical protein